MTLMPLSLAEAVFWIAVACCAIAQVAILRSIVISPTHADRSVPDGVVQRTTEIAWAVLPGVTLVFVFVYTWAAMHAPATVIIPR